MSSHTPPQGYQTPIDDDEAPPLTPRAASLLQAPSPHSAVMTVSLEGYLEPTRISFGSPPSSELNPRVASPDETFPVFSPPPDRSSQPRALSFSSWRVQRRMSVNSSRSQRSHHTCNVEDLVLIFD